MNLNRFVSLLFPPLPFKPVQLDPYPFRPMSNGERKAAWASKYYQLTSADKPVPGYPSGRAP